MRPYVLWLLIAVGLLAVPTQAAHVRQATSGSSSSLVSSYANDPRPDAVGEQASDILGTGGAYEFRLPQPQINKQQQQQQQLKTKRPNTNVTYITTTKTSSSSSSVGGVTKSSSTERPATSTTIATSGHKASGVTSTSLLPTPTTQGSSQLPGLAYNITVTPQQTQASYQPATPAVANDEPVVTTSNAVNDDESSKKVIGSSVVTSVSVILNGDEPEFTDALGHKVPKPQPSLQVASPIDLLNPDRYEFYTFDENGELVKRLMTMEEIQSIVANGDGENSSIVQHLPTGDREPEKNVQDIVDSVQNVLNKEVESNKNISKDALPVLDTPDVSSSWSMILPAIFGNGGGDIFPQQKPQQIVMTPDSELLEASTTTAAPLAHANTKRPKPNKRKPGQKRKPTTPAPTTTSTAVTPQVVQEELDPHESVYTGMQQYQNVAANMQHFDGFSQLQMQPIYHKLPEHTEVDTTTRRVFVNNQEIIQSVTTSRPNAVSTDKVELGESYGKRPPVVVHKRPVSPNRHKPQHAGEAAHTTRKPLGGHNKQNKNKKKPTTTTTTPEPTTTMTTIPEPTTTTTTTTRTTSTTTSTTPAPITTTPAPITTTTAPIPSSTTPKKKKKKPTRQPGQGNGKPHAAVDKRKPTTGKPRPTGASQHNGNKHPQAGEGTTQNHGNMHHTSADVPITVSPSPAEPTIHKHNATVSHKPNKTRPRPQKKPVHSTTTTTATTEPTTTTTTTTSTMTTTTTPEPTTTTTTSTTTSTTTPTPITTTAGTITTTESTLIVEHFPGYHPIHVKPSHANKRPGVAHYPVPHYKPTKQDVAQESNKPESTDIGQLKRKPLPSLAQIQQQHHTPPERPILLHEQNTLTAFDQIMESLKQELANKDDANGDISESSASEKRPVTDNPLKVEDTANVSETSAQDSAPNALSISTSSTEALVQKEESFNAVDTVSMEQEEMTVVEEDIVPEFVTTMRPPTFAAASEEVTKQTTTTRPVNEALAEESHGNLPNHPTEEQQKAPAASETVDVAVLEDKTTSEREEDISHVVKFEPLYADVQEPIVSEVPTTTVIPYDETTVSKLEYTNDDTTVVEVIDEVNVQTVDTSGADSSTEYQIPTIMQLPVAQKVETIIAENTVTTEPAPQVADLKPHLNMDVVKPTDQINMADFQTQAATIASTLVDGANTVAADLHMNSNETRSEIDFLLSDVLQQMAVNQPNKYRPDPVEDGNRLTSFAQLNTSFFLKPTQLATAGSNEGSETPIYSDAIVPISAMKAPPAVVGKPNVEPLLVPAPEPIDATEYDLTTELGLATEVLTYASKEDGTVEEHKLTLTEESTEKQQKEHEKEHKAELSLENTVHNAEMTQKPVILTDSTEKYELLDKAETQAQISSEQETRPKESTEENEKLKQKPQAHTESTEKEEVQENDEARPEESKNEPQAIVPSLSEIYAAQQQDQDDKESIYETRPDKAPQQSTESGNSAEPLTESETIILTEQLSAENSNEEKKEEMTSAEVIITEIEEEHHKPNEEIANNEKPEAEDSEQVSQDIEQQATEEYLMQTERIPIDETTQFASTSEDELLEEEHTVQTTEETTSEVGEESQIEVQTAEVYNDTQEIQIALSDASEDLQQEKETIINAESELNVGGITETPNSVNEKESNETESNAKPSTDTANKEHVSDENITYSEEVSELVIANKEKHEKESYEKDTEKESVEKLPSEKVANQQQSIEVIEHETSNSPVHSDTTGEETEAVHTEETSTEALKGSTEKATTANEEDNATDAADLQIQYTNPPSTATTATKYDSYELEEQTSSEAIEREATTTLPGEESTTTSSIAVDEENSGIEPEAATDVTVTISDEIDSTESDEDPYIKLGESTTKYSVELTNSNTSVDSTSIEEETPSDEAADLELTSPTLPQPIQQDVAEATTPAEEESTEESGEDIQTPQGTKVEPIKEAEAEPAKGVEEFSSTPFLELTVSTEEIPIKHIPKPMQSFITQQRPQMPQLNYEYRPDPQTAVDTGDLTTYIIPKFPTSPELAALSTTAQTAASTTTSTTTTISTTTAKPSPTTTKRIHTLKPVSYYNKHTGIKAPKPAEPTKVIPYSANTAQQRPMQRPAQLNNLMATSTQATRPPVKMEPSPANSKGLEASITSLDEDLQSFVKLCNELAFSYWKSITSEKISSARSLVVSPFALTSMLSMVFLGARGSTSGEMNEVLKLDDMVTFNPHLVFRNITDSVERATDSDIATTAFVREIFSDRANGKILQFFKEKTQQFYSGHVEEVNFHVVNDVIRRRTNLLVKRHTMGKVLEYLRTNSLWVNGPLATVSANLFQTDCRHGSTQLTDGEMFFQVHPSVRQRRLIPIPAVLYKSGFTAGYEPKLDATIVAFGSIQDTVSTVYVMPSHQSTLLPAESLERLERELVEQAFSKNAWSNILTALMDRPGMEVQLPRFSHRSFVNASLGLQKMGLKGLFKSDFADLRGLTGSSNRDIYLSDVIQINTFSTCGEEKIADHHHVEMYPAPPLRKRNKDLGANDDGAYDSSEAVIDFGSLVHESALGRGFYDDLLDPKYLELPLSLRPRQARVPDAPRLRFDKPFLYFVRHNPTGIILFMGRFNPRLLP